MAVCRKDLRVEFRTRYVYSALLMFAVTVMVTVSFTVGGFLPDSGIAAALLWIILFFSAMAGLSRTFVQEEETGTAAALRMAAAPETVLMGKYMYNAVLLFSLAVLLVPLFFVLLNQSVLLPGLFLAVLLLGLLGLAAVSTVLAAIVAKAEAKGLLMAVLSFPVLLPLLLTAVKATHNCLAGSREGVAASMLLLFCYDGVIITASFLLFAFIWDD